jgi:hypothetical protein
MVDPRLGVTQADLKAQFDLKLAIRDRVAETHDALNQISRVREQVDQWLERFQTHEQAQRLKDSARALKDQLAAVERELMNVDADKPRPGGTRIKEKLQALSGMISESEHAPTRGATEVYDMLSGQLEQQRRKLSEVLDQPLNEFNSLVSSLGIQPVAV